MGFFFPSCLWVTDESIPLNMEGFPCLFPRKARTRQCPNEVRQENYKNKHLFHLILNFLLEPYSQKSSYFFKKSKNNPVTGSEK